MLSLDLKARRSLLYVPASRPDRFPKAMESGADMVCVDLEDAVAGDMKVQARKDAIALFAADAGRAERLLRINASDSDDGKADLEAVAECDMPPDGVLLPKVKTADQVRRVADKLCARHAGLLVHVQLETLEGLE
ncbi:MAG: CoA ester lyase, partial [Rhodospirillales bacterium]|nr:CoA ester lyase [Rhodospirillales bacterium]